MKKETWLYNNTVYYPLGKLDTGFTLYMVQPVVDADTTTLGKLYCREKEFDINMKVWGTLDKLLDFACNPLREKNIYNNPIFKDTAFNEEEGKELTDLIKTYYTLKDTEQVMTQGEWGYHYKFNTNIVVSQCIKKLINEEYLWKIAKRITIILSKG